MKKLRDFFFTRKAFLLYEGIMFCQSSVFEQRKRKSAKLGRADFLSRSLRIFVRKRMTRLQPQVLVHSFLISNTRK